MGSSNKKGDCGQAQHHHGDHQQEENGEVAVALDRWGMKTNTGGAVSHSSNHFQSLS